jgi:hypothetical protein
MRYARPSAARLLDVAFFAGILAYVDAGIDTRLIYHWQAPAFYLTTEFLGEFLKRPGGLVEYLNALIVQAYAWQGWGAVNLTAQIAAVTALAGLWTHTLLRFAPALALLYAVNLYYDRTPLVPALLLALAAGLMPLRRTWMTAWLAVAVYYVGGMALVFFALGIAGMQIGRREYARGMALLVLAAVVPLAAEMAGIRGAAREWFVDADTRRVAVWWSLYVFCGVAGFLRGRGPALRRWPPVLAPVAVLVCLALVAALSYRTNGRDRRLAALDYHTSQENWPAAIGAASGLRSAEFNSLSRYEVNLALHQMGRMGDEMFRFPQAESTIPGLRAQVFLPYMIRLTDLFLRLGRINDAEHFGNEALILGESDPRVLRLMAQLQLVKGQSEAARKYLTVLSEEAGSARWARGRLRVLGDDPVLRRRTLRTDDVIAVWQNPDKPDADVNRLLLNQLEQDPSNRMAFEFLIGNHLLARDLPAARAAMPYIRHMSGPAYERRTPRHYQEAMAMYADGTGKPVEIEGLSIEPETLNRMAVFKRLLSQSPGRDAARDATWERFRDSYFFYFVFGPGDYR